MSDPFAPPPPYEVTQQYFDNKLDAALQESMAVLSNEEEMWEEWDEAAFEAAALEAARLSGDIGSSSSTLTPPLTSTQSHPQPHERVLPSAQPLRIKKKARPSVSSKDRPSWFEDAGLGQSSSSSTSQWQEDVRPSPSMHVSNASGFTSRQSTPQLPADDEEDRSIPPPPFTAVGPSLDGPPFTEVDPATYPRNAHESPPPSPLVSPTDIHTPLLTMASRLPLPEARHSPPRQSLPTPPRTHVRLGPRPSSSAGHAKPRPHMTAPYVSFDPSVVYTKPGPVTGVQPRVNEVPSLYNSAVTAHLPSWSNRPPLNVATPQNIYPSQRPQSSAGGLRGHNAPPANNNDWAHNLYAQYPTTPVPPTLPVVQQSQYQPQQQSYQHYSHSGMGPQGQLRYPQ